MGGELRVLRPQEPIPPQSPSGAGASQNRATKPLKLSVTGIGYEAIGTLSSNNYTNTLQRLHSGQGQEMKYPVQTKLLGSRA